MNAEARYEELLMKEQQLEFALDMIPNLDDVLEQCEYVVDPTQAAGLKLVESKLLDKLLDESHFLSCLRNAGVDNWGGFDDAQAMYNGEEE